MSGTVSVSGLVSNTDWSNVIDQIINAETATTITPLQNKITGYQSQQSAWVSFNSTLSAIYNYIDSNNLNKDSGYQLYTSSLSCQDSSDTPSNVLSVALDSTAGTGTYTVEVTKLAQAEKISSSTFSSNSTALGLSGDIVLNGKKVNLASTDTLANVASKINNSNTGVTASVVSVSSTDYRLTLQSATTGTAGISLKDGDSGNLLESLNLLTSTKQLTHASGANALSDSYTDQTTAVGTLLGLTSSQSGTIQIQGTDGVSQSVNVNLGTDSLQTIANNINSAGVTGVTASVVPTTTNGTTTYQLQMTNVGVGNLTDQNNVLQTLGVIVGGRTSVTQQGQDASITLDNSYTITSSSNTVTNAVSGITFNLLATNVDNPITVTVSQDTSQISSKVSTLVSDINSALSYISDQNTYSSPDSSGNTTTKPLFGDVNLTLVKNTISDAVYTEASGNSTYHRLSDIGITYQKDGTLAVDSSKLSTALSANPTEVLNILKTVTDKLDTTMHSYIDPTTGTLTYMNTALQDQIDTANNKIDDLNARYDRERDRLESQFNALELLINQSDQTKSWLTQQTDYLTGTKS